MPCPVIVEPSLWVILPSSKGIAVYEVRLRCYLAERVVAVALNFLPVWVGDCRDAPETILVVIVEISVSLQDQVLVNVLAMRVETLGCGAVGHDLQGNVVAVVDVGPGGGFGDAVFGDALLLLDPPAEGVVYEGDGLLIRSLTLFHFCQLVFIVPSVSPALVAVCCCPR